MDQIGQSFHSKKVNLKDMRITVKNILFVIGLPSEMAQKTQQELSNPEHFGQYGQVIKLTVNDKPYGKATKGSNIFSVHVNYSNNKEASIAMLALHDKTVNQNKIKASFGTTKYCKSFLEGKFCYNKECLYYHELDTENEMNKVTNL